MGPTLRALQPALLESAANRRAAQESGGTQGENSPFASSLPSTGRFWGGPRSRVRTFQTQAIHTQTGFTLRRFNTDISQEEFETELERLNVSLVLENQALQQENRQLSILLKDYEGTLEAVMAKFRAHAHATQQHHLDLVRHYEGILLSLPSAALPSPDSTSATAIDPLHLSLSLAHLASLIRKALRSLQGEDPEDTTSPLLLPSGSGGPTGPNGVTGAFDQMEDDLAILPGSSASASSSAPGTGLSNRRQIRDESEGGYIGRNSSTQPHYIHTTSTSSLVSPNGTPAQVTEAKGLGPVDEALEREIELEALRRENEELRRLLGISADLDQNSSDH